MQTDNNHCLTTEGANQYPASTIEVVRSFISFLKFASLPNLILGHFSTV